MVHFIFIAPMHSYVTNVLVHNLHMTIFSRVYSYVLVCTRMLLVCYSYVLVCYSYVLVCTRMLLVCYSCVVLVTINTDSGKPSVSQAPVTIYPLPVTVISFQHFRPTVSLLRYLFSFLKMNKYNYVTAITEK